MLATGKGSYLENVIFGEGDDQEEIWTINDLSLVTTWLKPDVSQILESDGTRRKDAQAIAIKSWTTAEEEKHKLEELQRRDKKLRDVSY